MKAMRFTLIVLAGFSLVSALIFAFVDPQVLLQAIQPLLMLLIPLALAVFLLGRFKLPQRFLWVGALTFIGSQVLHIPFNSLALNPFMLKLGLSYEANTWGLLGSAALLGLSAGVFEEVARYLVLRFWLKDVRTWRSGIVFGAGHGGVEAFLLGLTMLATFIQMMLFRDPAYLNTLPANQVGVVQSGMNLYWGTPGYVFMLAVLERICAMTFHIAAALLVVQAVARRNLLWLGLAVLWHTLLDMAAVYGSVSWTTLQTEGVVMVFALLSALMIYAFRKMPGMDTARDAAAPEEQAPIPGVLPVSPPAVSLEKKLNEDKLEQSRYE